jgi:hypothetical protein
MAARRILLTIGRIISRTCHIKDLPYRELVMGDVGVWCKEVEHCYEIPDGALGNVLRMIETQALDAGGATLRRSSRKRVTDLQLMASNEFRATREMDGVRHRLTFRLRGESLKIKYTQKRFEAGDRFQRDMELGDDYVAAFAILSSMPAIDALMMKDSIRATFMASHLDFVASHKDDDVVSCSLKIILDECRALHPLRLDASPPMRYVELEASAAMLSAIAQEQWLSAVLASLRPMRYRSHNRLRFCLDHWPGPLFAPANPDELSRMVKTAFDHHTKTTLPGDAAAD